MSFHKFKKDSYCVGGRHRSATTKIYGDITSKGSKVLLAFCSICIRKKNVWLFLIIQYMQKDWVVFSKFWYEFLLKLLKKLASNILKNPGRALEIGAKIGTAFSSRNLKATLTTLLEVINFYHKGRGIDFGKFV